LCDVRGEVLIGATRAYGGSDHPAGCYLQVGEQAPGAVAFVLVFVALDQPGTHRKLWVNSLQCLYPTLLVCAHQVHTFFVEVQRLGVAFANPSNLRIKDLWLSRSLVMFPGAYQMRLQIRLSPKNGPHCVPRCSPRCPV
jgi:hypothetical protein